MTKKINHFHKINDRYCSWHSKVAFGRKNNLNALYTAILLLVMAAGFISCKDDPYSPEVSDTERWRLVLEQAVDGTEPPGAVYPHRGTINLQLNLNRTTQPDPACEDAEDPNVTTFYANVKTIPSWLHPAMTTGTADGSWNCHGIAATVRLDDGTIFTLNGENRTPFAPGAEITPCLYKTEVMRQNTWVSGTRYGYFAFAKYDENFPERWCDPLDTHVEVRFHNEFDQNLFFAVNTFFYWNGHNYKTETIEESGFRLPLSQYYQDLPMESIVKISVPDWLGFPPGPLDSGVIDSVRNYFFWVSNTQQIKRLECNIGIDHPDVVHIVIDEDGYLFCDEGWILPETGEGRAAWLQTSF